MEQSVLDTASDPSKNDFFSSFSFSAVVCLNSKWQDRSSQVLEEFPTTVPWNGMTEFTITTIFKERCLPNFLHMCSVFFSMELS